MKRNGKRAWDAWDAGTIRTGFALAGLLSVAGSPACSDCHLALTCEEYREECGNGVVEPGEECDDGTERSDTVPDACRTTCVKASCGDGVIDSGEACDGDSEDPHAGCAPTCEAAGCVVGRAPYPTVQSAVDDAGCAVIVVPAGTYEENLTIARDVEIIGTGAQRPVIDGGEASSVLVVASGQVTLRNLAVIRGKATEGGGIRNFGTLTLDGCSIKGNTVTGVDAKGGGVYSAGTLIANATTIARNRAHRGGGIYNAGGDVEMAASEVTENTADDVFTGATVDEITGGGIHSEGGTLALRYATRVRGNVASGWLTEANLKVGQNEAVLHVQGGGIYATATEVTVDASEVSENSASATLAVHRSSNVFDLKEIRTLAEGAGAVIANGALTLTSESAVARNMASSTLLVAPASLSFAGVSAIGGGISASKATLLLLEGSSVSQNKALGTGKEESFSQSNVSWVGGAGGILGSSSMIEVEGSTIEDNLAEGAWASGGALALESNCTLVTRQSALRGNIAHATVGDLFSGRALGGAVSAYNSVIEAEDSVIEHNEARGADSNGRAYGGAFDLSSGTSNSVMKLVLRRSTLSENTALGAAVSGGVAYGGGIHAESGTGDAQTIVQIIDSTVSGNVARSSPLGDVAARGGAISLSSGTGSSISTLVLRSATITANRAEGATAEAGGIRLVRTGATSLTSASFANSIVAGNQAAAAPDCATTSVVISSDGNNAIGSQAGCSIDGNGVSFGLDAMFLPLGNYGGPTPTHALAAGSLAINAGSAAGCLDENGGLLTIDQRGRLRHEGPCDLGAVERHPDDP